MKFLYIATLSFVLLISACSDTPDTQTQSEPLATEAVAETSKPTPAAESKQSQVTDTSKPATVAEASDNIAAIEAFQATIELMIAEDDLNAEKCIIDPVTDLHRDVY